MSDTHSDSNEVRERDDSSSTAQSSLSPRFSLRSLFIVTMVSCALLAAIVPLIRAANQASTLLVCTNNLKQIALALNNYHDVNGMFPWAVTYAEDGTPIHSWRVRIMPYLEQNPFYDRYDFHEPWNGPKNRLLGDEVPDTWRDNGGHVSEYVYCPAPYRCPSAPRTQDRRHTNYVMLIDDRPGKPNGPPNRPGGVPTSFADRSAVIVIEIADSDIHWMEPRDVLLSELSMKINDHSKRSLSSYHGGACIAHADGRVEILDEATTEERVRELLTL